MGIKHLEHLPRDQFIHVIQTLDTSDITEKVDGANACFASNQHGHIYLDRGMKRKTDAQFYLDGDFPRQFWATGFRSALKAIQQADLQIPSTGIQAELLYGNMPNVIRYDGMNRIVWIDEGPAIRDAIEVELEVPVTTDGIKIDWVMKKHRWSMGRCTKKRISDTVINKLCTSTDMQQVEVRDDEQAKQRMKMELLNSLPSYSQFGNEVEGYVIKTKTGIITKLVDRNGFTQRNQLAHALRRKLSGKAFGRPLKDSVLWLLLNDRNNGVRALNEQYQAYMAQPDTDVDIHQRNLQCFAELYCGVGWMD